jgi:hypothetical protein
VIAVSGVRLHIAVLVGCGANAVVLVGRRRWDRCRLLRIISGHCLRRARLGSMPILIRLLRRRTDYRTAHHQGRGNQACLQTTRNQVVHLKLLLKEQLGYLS